MTKERKEIKELKFNEKNFDILKQEKEEIERKLNKSHDIIAKIRSEIENIKRNDANCIEFRIGGNPNIASDFRILSGGIDEIISKNILMLKKHNAKMLSEDPTLWVIVGYKKDKLKESMDHARKIQQILIRELE